MRELPPPRDPLSDRYAVTLVCLGNICRSPMAEVVLRHKLEAAGIAGRVALDSSGTGTWHLDEAMHPPAARLLSAAGYDPTRHRARHFERRGFEGYDAILVMDDLNLIDVRRLAPTDADRERVLLFREFDPDADGDLAVPDPFNGGERDFQHVLDIVERTTDALVTALESATERS